MHTREDKQCGSDEREMRKMGRQAIERQKQSKRYNTERKLTAVTAELYISWFVLLDLLEFIGKESISVSDSHSEKYFNESEVI